MVVAPITLQQLPFDLPLNVLSGHMYIYIYIYMTQVSKPTIKIKHMARILKHGDVTHCRSSSKPL